MVEGFKVFDGSDEKLKILGELLSNETSRKIIKSLIEREMYTNEIATKLDMRMNLVIHHLKKLKELGLLEITHKKIVRKGNNHKYFRMIPGIVIFPSENKDTIENGGILKKFFKDGIKFSLVAISGFVTWFGINFTENKNSISLDRSVYDVPDIVEEIPQETDLAFDSILVIPIIVTVCGLLLIWFSKK